MGRYRKRIKDADGNYVAIYGRTPEELTEKLAEAQRQIDEAVFRRDNPTVEDYATKWLTMHSSHIRTTTLVDYTSKVKIYIIEPLGKKYMAEITPDDVKLAINKAAQQSASIYRGVQMLYKMIFLRQWKAELSTNPHVKISIPGAGRAEGKNRSHRSAGQHPFRCGSGPSSIPIHHAMPLCWPAPGGSSGIAMG